MPPLARLASLYPVVCDDPIAAEGLSVALKTADYFTKMSSSEEWRFRVKTVSSLSQAGLVPEFEDMRERARLLQTSLENIFFGSKILGPISRRYLSF